MRFMISFDGRNKYINLWWTVLGRDIKVMAQRTQTDVSKKFTYH